MRISDWSSDVCSSDLNCAHGGGCTVSSDQVARIDSDRNSHGTNNITSDSIDSDSATTNSRHTAVSIMPCPRTASPSTRRRSRRRAASAPDRKSVVSGKSVSVRVDLGGRRIIKKKTRYDLFNIHDNYTQQIQETNF